MADHGGNTNGRRRLDAVRAVLFGRMGVEPMMLSDLVPPHGLSVERDILAHDTVKELKLKLEE